MLGQAIGYSLNQWDKLMVFTKDARLYEHSIKPSVIGHKNWLFAHTPRGTKANSAIYSVNVTTKGNGLHPFRYLTCLFDNCLSSLTCRSHRR
ncbi:IS66 family transposase [Paenibacillus sp. FSL H8-0034]|uniref:IS66 family transposase n=1 Tax=Paenibacillus sp. FSL H8-0034 TaxID=2954671 RepID=UPI004046D94E